MAEKESPNEPKDVVEATPEELEKLEEEVLEVEEVAEDLVRSETPKEEKPFLKEELASWVPKTKLGRMVKEGKIKNIDEILDSGRKILEPEISDALLNLESEMLMIGQVPGKFGGGRRRAWRQTQKKTQEGNIMSFSAMAVVGDRAGHVGIGTGKARETLPAREKAVRNAKLNIIKIQLGFESPENEKDRKNPHTIPFRVSGKCGSVRVTFWPAPRGTGLVAGEECRKILRLAGVKDVYSRATGQTRTTFNLARACIDALKKTNEMEVDYASGD